MDILSKHYGAEDGRYHSTKAIETVLAYAIENLSDGVGGTITLIPMNDLEDIPVIYRAENCGIQIGQINLCDDDATHVDIPEKYVPALLAAINNANLIK